MFQHSRHTYMTKIARNREIFRTLFLLINAICLEGRIKHLRHLQRRRQQACFSSSHPSRRSIVMLLFFRPSKSTHPFRRRALPWSSSFRGGFHVPQRSWGCLLCPFEDHLGVRLFGLHLDQRGLRVCGICCCFCCHHYRHLSVLRQRCEACEKLKF